MNTQPNWEAIDNRLDYGTTAKRVEEIYLNDTTSYLLEEEPVYYTDKSVFEELSYIFNEDVGHLMLTIDNSIVEEWT